MLQDNAVPMGSNFTSIMGDLKEAIILSQEKYNAIGSLWYAIHEYYGAQMNPMQHRWFTEDLLMYEVEEVEEAMIVYRRMPLQKGHSPKPPVPAQLKAIISPETDTLGEANRLANELWGNIHHVGRYNETLAEEKCGPLVWEAVRLRGGWWNLCNVNTDEQHMFIAQMRDFLRPILETHGTAAHLKLRDEARAFLNDRREQKASNVVQHIGQVVRKLAPNSKP